jgi:hypothetical protein
MIFQEIWEFKGFYNDFVSYTKIFKDYWHLYVLDLYSQGILGILNFYTII